MKDGDVQCVYPQKQDAQQEAWVWEGQGGQIDRGGQPSQLCSVKHKQGQDVSDQSEQNNSGQQDSMQKKSHFHQVPYALGLGECQCEIFWSVPKNFHIKRYSFGYYLLTLMDWNVTICRCCLQYYIWWCNLIAYFCWTVLYSPCQKKKNRRTRIKCFIFDFADSMKINWIGIP